MSPTAIETLTRKTQTLSGLVVASVAVAAAALEVAILAVLSAGAFVGTQRTAVAGGALATAGGTGKLF